MKIAVVGCGALGSFYGAQLGRAGHEVHFLLRSDYETVRRKGVFIHSPAGNFHFQPRAAREPPEIGVADLVIVALKTTANDQFPALLPPLTGPRTAVLTLQNGLGNEDALARLFPPEQILGGLCFVCLNRTAPGVIHHLDHGAVVLGEFQRWPEPRTHDFASAFRQAGLPCDVTDNLERTHWEKLVWNIPFNGLGVASAAGYEAVISGHLAPGSGRQPCLTTDRLLAEPRWEVLVRELMQEVITAAQAQNLDVSEALAEKQIARTRTMGAYRASTLVDFEHGLPLELESLFLDPLRRGERAHGALPRLHALSQVLQALDAEQDRP